MNTYSIEKMMSIVTYTKMMQICDNLYRYKNVMCPQKGENINFSITRFKS